MWIPIVPNSLGLYKEEINKLKGSEQDLAQRNLSIFLLKQQTQNVA